MTTPVTVSSITDPFESDVVRSRLARQHELSNLQTTSKPGVLPELGDMSSASLWDTLATCSDAPAFRTRRLSAVAGELKQGTKVLDIGIGWGEIIPMVLARGCTYSGIDFSEQIVAHVSKRYPQCRFFSGGLEQISETYDSVLALEVCEHILPSKIFSFYDEIRRLLARNGTLIITVPVYENLRAMTLHCPQCGHMHNRMGHVRAYTPELIRAELQLAGFIIEKSFFIYASFENSLTGTIKRKLVDFGRRLLNLGQTVPLNVVVVARKAD
jgi:2-polyprenyl-3-methyl-5-hydroxy-6-metoxy-1,4-benzoquinol methylase